MEMKSFFFLKSFELAHEAILRGKTQWAAPIKVFFLHQTSNRISE